MDGRFEHTGYLIRRKVFKLAGAAFHVFDGSGGLVAYADQKAFRLREDIRLYTGEDKQHELLVILARQVLDVSAAYDVVDPATGETVGTLQRRGLRSMIRDEWTIFDAAGKEVGLAREESQVAALLRRFIVGGLLPQSFRITVSEQEVARFHQRFNPFVLQLDLDFTPDPSGLLDRRLGLAAGVLFTAIEGRQG